MPYKVLFISIITVLNKWTIKRSIRHRHTQTLSLNHLSPSVRLCIMTNHVFFDTIHPTTYCENTISIFHLCRVL